MLPDFPAFPKVPRFSREITITEKIDGTNGVIHITDAGEFFVGSRTRWITPENDNHGFAKWAYANRADLERLGPGTHYGEWWGQGIQRRYGLAEKRFSLFNTSRWGDPAVRPACCHIVPVLYQGPFEVEGTLAGVKLALANLESQGSVAAPGFPRPEGIMIYHHASGSYFKKTLEKDAEPKGNLNA